MAANPSAPPPTPSQADPLETTRRAASPRVRRRRTRLWVSIGSGIVLSVITLLVVLTQGSVSGREFAPTHFQSREFHFYEIPLVHWQITPIQRKAVNIEVLDLVRRKSWIQRPAGQPKQWHLVHLSRGLSGIRFNDPSLLIRSVEPDVAPTGELPWESWSNSHPAAAAILWPRIQMLANRELYLFIPGALQLAREVTGRHSIPSTAASQLDRGLDEYLRQEYRSLVADLRLDGKNDLADQFEQEARKEGWADPTPKSS